MLVVSMFQKDMQAYVVIAAFKKFRNNEHFLDIMASWLVEMKN